MTQNFKVMLLSFDTQQCEHANALLSNLKEVESEIVQLDDNFAHQFQSIPITSKANLVLYFLGPEPENELRQLVRTNPAQRPHQLILISDKPDDPIQTLRLSLQLGALDHLMRPFTHKELLSAVQKSLDDRKRVIKEEAQIITCVSPGGGFGCSSLCAGLAVAMETLQSRSTLLLDLNLQFGTQYLYHDLTPDKGLKEAIENIETLDPTALAGYVTRHESGVDHLGILPDQLILMDEIDRGDLVKLINLLAQAYEVLIIDLPGHVDALFSLMMERSSNIVLVLKQDVRSVNLGLKLTNLLKSDLDVPVAKLSVVINQADTKQLVSEQDVHKALALEVIAKIPFDPQAFKRSANLGVPILKQAPKGSISKAYLALSDQLTPKNEEESRNDSLVQWFLNRLKRLAA